MKSYVEETMHVDVKETEKQLQLPLSINNAYKFRQWIIQDQSILFALPQTNVSIITLEKHFKKLSKMTNTPVVFGFNMLSTYKMNQMTAKGIPFILNEEQIYMPFMGILLHKSHLRELPEVTKVSLQTQRFILLSIYKNWTRLSLAEVAIQLGVSKMTVSRIFDELEGIDSSLVDRDGKERFFSRKEDTHTFWNTLYPYLFNPVVRDYRLEKKIQPNRLMTGGLSAFSEYTMLNGPDYPIYAITREEEKALRLKEMKTVRSDEDPACIVQVVKYRLESNEGRHMDPLSIILSLSDYEKEDPRIGIEIERLMERVFQGWKG